MGKNVGIEVAVSQRGSTDAARTHLSGVVASLCTYI